MTVTSQFSPQSPFTNGERGCANAPGPLFGQQIGQASGYTPHSPFAHEQRGQANPPNPAAHPQFGNSVSRFFTRVMENPASRVIAEDLIGFGLLRTIFDLTRNFFYSHDPTQGFLGNFIDNIKHAVQPNPKRPQSELFNKSMARERIIREGGNLFSANFLAGIVIAGLAGLANWMGRGPQSMQQASMEALEVFRDATGKVHTPEGFVAKMADFLSEGNATTTDPVAKAIQQTIDELSPAAREQHVNQLKALLANSTDAKAQKIATILANHPAEKALAKTSKQLGLWSHLKNLPEELTALKQQLITRDDVIHGQATKIAKTLNPNATIYDIERKLPVSGYRERFSIRAFLQDTLEFHQDIAQAKPHATRGTWQHQAQDLIKRTRRFNRFGLPVAYAAAFVFTVLVPIWNRYYTEKVDKTKSYPGVKGLKALEPLDNKKKPFLEELMPYVTQQTKQGNYWPLIWGLLPLPFAFGLVNNGALNSGNFKKVFNNPFAKGFLKKTFRLFQFRKGFPYMSVQQVAALCATVASTRNLVVRERSEARERLIDTYAGWIIWIALLPNIKTWLAKRMDNARGTVMTKIMPNGNVVMRDAEEIRRFFSKDVAGRTMKVLKPLEKWTFALMVLVMGVVEPLIAIKWTEAQIHEETAKKPGLPKPAY